MVDTTIQLIKKSNFMDKKLCRVYLKALETLILNEHNLYQSITLGLIPLLMGILMEDRYNQTEKLIAIRSVAFSCKKQSIISYISSDPQYLTYLGEALKVYADMDILFECTKIIRKLLRDSAVI